MNVEYVDFDDLALSSFDAETVRSQVTKLSSRLHADGKLRIHFSKHQHSEGHSIFSVNLFFEHEGHKHATDKHHGRDLGAVLKDAFEALETQIEKDRKLVGFNANKKY